MVDNRWLQTLYYSSHWEGSVPSPWIEGESLWDCMTNRICLKWQLYQFPGLSLKKSQFLLLSWNTCSCSALLMKKQYLTNCCHLETMSWIQRVTTSQIVASCWWLTCQVRGQKEKAKNANCTLSVIQCFLWPLHISEIKTL